MTFGREIRARSACYRLTQAAAITRGAINHHHRLMTTSLLVALIALLLIPLVLIWRLTETRPQTIQRLRRNGQTWKAIGNRYGVSRTTAARWAVA